MKTKSALVLLLVVNAHAQAANSLTIDARNRFLAFNNPIFDDDGITPLAAANLIQLGYFSSSAPNASGALEFGNFVPLEDPNGDLALALGLDNEGTFIGQVEITDVVNAPLLTSQTARFGLRFYNGSDPASSTFFNTVTSPDWNFSFVADSSTVTSLPSTIDLSGFNQSSTNTIASAVWQGTAFRTDVAIPEPSTLLSALLGGLLLVTHRRRN